VHELRRPAAGPCREVARIDERGLQPAHGCVARNSRAGDPCTDHENVKNLRGETREQRVAVTQIEREGHLVVSS
jgi:hypothetical protein